MAVHFKTFVQILMAMLALGIVTPQPVCGAGTVEAVKTCCCNGSAADMCHSDQPCKSSCTRAQVQTFDKQLPARTVAASSVHGSTFLFSIMPTRVKYLVSAPVARQRGLDASPPFAGSPPQAKLRLWLL